MNAGTQSVRLQGPVGAIEAAIDMPQAEPLGTAVIAHPHPLFGGTMHNKVVQTLARAFVQTGWRSVRFHFRGVGTSEGVHDAGLGETDDLLAVLAQTAPAGPVALAGFSFGAYVTARALAHLDNPDLRKLVLVGTAASRFVVPPIAAPWHDRTLVIHGEQDDTVPLASVMDWARPQALPVTVVPGGEHFFHGQLPLLKSLVLRHLLAPLGS